MLAGDRRPLSFALLLAACHATLVRTADVAKNWTNPNGNAVSFSNTYLVGERILLSWQPLNVSTDDLWLTRYDTTTDDFALRIASQINIGNAGSFAWQIAVEDDEVLKDTRFELQWVPTGQEYNADAPTRFSSPAFNVMLVNQASPANGTASTTQPSSTDAAAATTTPSATDDTNTSANDGSSTAESGPVLSKGATLGIALAVLVAVVLVSVVFAYWWFKRRHTKKVDKLVGDSQTDMQGPYEALGDTRTDMQGPYEASGDRRQPIELTTKEVKVHEMNSSSETIVKELDSPVIHELANTVKRPGLHEMPG